MSYEFCTRSLVYMNTRVIAYIFAIQREAIQLSGLGCIHDCMMDGRVVNFSFNWKFANRRGRIVVTK